MIKLRAQFLDYPIKTIILDNASEFTFQTFTNYCMSIGINVEHPIAHTYIQNCLAESKIKRLQLISRLLLMKTKLLTFAYKHAIMHTASLVCIDQQLTINIPLYILYLANNQIFLTYESLVVQCVYQLHLHNALKMGPQRRLEIYVGFDSPFIIRYLKPLTGNVFTTRFTDCHFNESVSPPLGREKWIPKKQREITWNASTDVNWSSKDHSFVKTCKSIIRCIY